MSNLRGAAALGAFLILAGCGTSTIVDPCSSQPCQNGGLCSVDADGRTLCECPTGYSGLTCNIVEGLCSPNPCENGGVCSAGASTFTCACPSGFSGARCQTTDTTQVSCTPNPCLNAGTCAVVAGVAECTCAMGYSGPTCAVQSVGCTPNPCLNAGTCAVVSGVAECTCAMGYSGPTCAVQATACSPNPCLNGGTCSTDAMGKAVCACVGEYGGSTCSVYVPPGDLDLSTVSTFGRVCADGGDMVDYSVSSLTSTTATLASTPTAGCLAVGDEVLLINLQGTDTHIFNTGNWELLKIQSISGAVITFAVAKQRAYGDDVGSDTNIGSGPSKQRVVLQRVPRYPGIEVPSGRALTASAWDSTQGRGGVFAMRLDTDGTFVGPVNMVGKGYRGGVTNSSAGTNGQSGESLRAITPLGPVPSTGGGGGGVGDCGMFGFGYSAGGGGYGTDGSDGADSLCSGGGGVAYGDDALSGIFFGSGGGAGGTPNSLASSPPGGFGGAGGGIIIILAGGKVSGSLLAAGRAGYGDAAECTLSSASTTDCWDTSGPGGGGAGGSILVRAMSAMGSFDISGGLGGDGQSVTLAPGNGGVGGSGRSKIN